MSYPFRVHYLAASFVPYEDASSVHVVRMAAALSEQTAEVELFCKQGMDRAIDSYYGLSKPLKINAVPFSNRLGLLRYLYALGRTASPDLALGRYAYASYWAALRGTPVLYEVHAPATGIKRRIEQQLFKHQQLLGVISITEALAEEYRRQYPQLEGRLLVLPDAANDPGAQPPPKTDGPLTAAYAGGWFQGRGIDLILALARSLPNYRFRLAGGTRSTLDGMGLSAPANVECVGYLPPAAVDDFLRSADVLLAPYAKQVSAFHGNALDTTDWCSPMKLFEYLSHGKAIVCSDLPVLREVLNDGENALLPPPQDLAAWTAALQRLDEDRSLARRLGATARKHFLERHTWAQRAERALAFAAARLQQGRHSSATSR